MTGPGNDGLVVNESVAQLYGLTREDVARLAEPELDELERRRQAYLGQRPKVPVRGKTVILVDDGIATGTTVRSALVALRQQGPKRIILAVPVASADVLADLENQVDRVVCPEPHLHFGAVGGAYRVFDQVADSTVIDLMQQDLAT